MASITSLLLLALTSLLLLLPPTAPEPTQDKSALQDFLAAVPHSRRLNWDPSTSPCAWSGVQCDSSRSYITALRLPAAGLVSHIPSNTISRLSRLRVLSLRSNGLYGAIPDDFSNLTLLRSLYLQQNRLSGGFPESLTLLTHLTRLDLSNNNFSGPIPERINNLTRLNRLFLQSNDFSGELPSIGTKNLAEFNVSENRLNGSIPKSLVKYPKSSFAGNSNLCGGPFAACKNNNPSSPASTPAKAWIPHKFSAVSIAGIAVASAVFFLIIFFSVLLCLMRKSRRQPAKSPKRGPPPAVTAAALAANTSSSKEDVTSGAVTGEKNKLVFMDGGGSGGYTFDLEDLLRASAEVLGKGSLGTSYKAVLEGGTTVVVKRLKEVSAAKREFEMQMEVLGECVHPNVVPLRAYYFSRDERLLVCDHFQVGSLSALLHGNKGAGRTSLDWNDRIKTALGAGRGLAYLHKFSNVIHGNIKSSNILLRQDCKEAAVCDFGLNSLFGNSTPQNKGVSYRAPEVTETRMATFKSDVYSFGVLLLELISGKAPNQTSGSEEGVDLPRWVQSVARDEWTSEVFDKELMMDDNVEEEMTQLLQIAMSCVQPVPDQRPTMPEVVHMMEGVTQIGSEGVQQSLDDSSRGSGDQTQFVGMAESP